MKIRNTKDVSIDDVQYYLMKGAFVHPKLYYEFLIELREMEYKRKLCLLPIARLQLYTGKVQRNIAIRNAA